MGPYGPLWAHIGPYGPLWAHMGPYGSSWTGLGRSGHDQITTFGGISHVIKKLNDSAWLLLEKLKKHIILTKNLNILPKILNILQKS